MSKVLISRPLPQVVLDRAQAHFDIDTRLETLPMSRTEMLDALRTYDGILPTLGDRFSADVFAGATPVRARMLANFGVGYNHIDVSAARAAGLEVSNTPGAVTDATADTAMTLLLMTARRAGEGERMVRAGQWQGWHPTQMLGQHVTGKVLGVIGMGRIGQAIARRAHFGFGMEVVFFNRSPVETEFPSRQLKSLGDVMRTADFAVVAVPGGADTRHLIDHNALAVMKPTGVFVNISRGDVVDEAALTEVLRDRRIAGAGLDVYEFEPDVPQALRALENVVLLPHLGTAALEVREAMGLMAVDNLIAFFDGKVPPNRV